jgi:CRP-like cAMP-binding protein
MHQNSIIAALPPSELEKYFSTLRPIELSLKEIMCSVGDPIEHVDFIERGIASALIQVADGATVEVGMIGREGMVGVQSLLGSEVSDQHVVVQVPGAAMRMGVGPCRVAFDNCPSMRRATLRFTASLLGMASQTAACNRLHSIEQRFARWLLMALSRVDGDEIPMTHEFLSSMIGSRRVGITEVATMLRGSGIISYHHGIIRIIDRKKLEQVACECHRIDHAWLFSK